MSKFATSFTNSLYEVMKPSLYRGAWLYENTDGSWTWKDKEITRPTKSELERVVDGTYNTIAKSIRIAKP
jgi:hypothetical protein